MARSGHVEEHRLWALQGSDDLVRERCAHVAVDDAVIEAEAEQHDLADDDLIVSHHWLLLDLVHAENAHLGEVEDRRREEAALRAEARDRERRAREIRRCDRARLRRGAEAIDLARDLEDRLLIGVLHHRDHQALIRRAMEVAASCSGTAVVMTFDRHPASLLRPELAPKLLTRNAEKISLMEELGVPALLLLPFTSELAAVSAQDFIKELVSACQPLRALCVGRQWSFGKGGEGNVARLRELGLEWNFDVIQIDPVETAGAPISSTRVRTAISSGDLNQAAACLGRPFQLSGDVITGAGLGSKIGFPTANLDFSGMQLPPYGVYAVKVLRGGSILTGVCNIGLRPTVDASANAPVVEVHLFDLSADLVRENLSLEFVKFLRPEHKFSGIDELKEQIVRDCTAARQTLSF